MGNTIIQIIIMQFSAVLCYIYLFGPNMILGALSWKMHGLRSSHNVKTKFQSHMQQKAKLLFSIFSSVFLDSKQENGRFGTKW
jgi:hypothetical protein